MPKRSIQEHLPILATHLLSGIECKWVGNVDYLPLFIRFTWERDMAVSMQSHARGASPAPTHIAADAIEPGINAVWFAQVGKMIPGF